MFAGRTVLYWPQFAVDPSAAMASDEWLLTQAERFDQPVVRFYTWKSPAITIGYHQQPDRAVVLSAMGETPLIRRVTGGRALLHDQSELTYSLLLPLPAGARLSAATIADRYAQLLRQFLMRLGIAAVVERAGKLRERAAADQLQSPCMSAPVRSELTARNQKVVAAAQRIVGTHFFQHGAIKWRGVSAHPALLGIGSIVSPEAVEPEQFEAASLLFTQTLHDDTGAQIAPLKLTPADQAALDHLIRQRTFVPLVDTHFIEQPQPQTSL